MILEELRMLQNYPLDLKIAKSKLRIKEFVEHFGRDGVYISFSGGKDSTVLLHLVRSLYPDIEAVFSNTGLEFPELVKFVKTKENITIVKPKKTFKQVLEEDGYPLISKKTARMINTCQHPTIKNKATIKLYLSNTVVNKKGETIRNCSFKIANKWQHLIDSDIKVSHKCCDHLKKNPLKEYEKYSKKKPIIGIMAGESTMRENSYLKRNGCNSFDDKKASSLPLSFWTEQDILQYLLMFDLEFASVYGKIIEVDGIYKTTGESRTGCVWCPLGVHLEKGENRFQRLERTHPQLHDYCMRGGKLNEEGKWIPDKGLGMAYIYDRIGVNWTNTQQKVDELVND